MADKKEEAKAPITDVKFVKHPEWRTGMVTADVDTGFQVGGGAIVPVPDAETHPDAHASAVRLLRSGLIEPASQAEWDEHQETNAPDHAVREAIRDELVQQQAVPAGAYAFARHPVAGGLATPDHVRRQALAAKRRAKKAAGGASGKESGGKVS